MSQLHWLFAKKTRFISIQKLTSAFYEKYVSSNSVHNKLYAESICCSLYAEPFAQAHTLQITVHIKGSNLNIACQRGNLWYVNWFLHLYFVRRNSPNMINIFLITCKPIFSRTEIYISRNTNECGDMFLFCINSSLFNNIDIFVIKRNNKEMCLYNCYLPESKMTWI